MVAMVCNRVNEMTDGVKKQSGFANAAIFQLREIASHM